MEKNDLCHTEHFLKTLSSFIKLDDWAKSNSEFGLEEILLLSLIHCDMSEEGLNIILLTKNTTV